MAASDLNACLDLISSSHIMTIGTCGSAGAWTAPVYYVFENPRFYFFSSPSSRHIKEALLNQQAAAAIHNNPTGWQDIKGVQMEGRICKEASLAEGAVAFKKYWEKFSFLPQLFGFNYSLAGFQEFEAKFSLKWYYFVPDQLFFLDNSKGFGYRCCFKSLCPTRS